MLVQLKSETEAANQKWEHMMAENEIKRQKMSVDTNAAVLKEKLQADLKKDLEFQQIQQKRDRAVAVQQKLRELAGQELEERIHLERELAQCKHQNLLLQKQGEIGRSEAHADRRLVQKGTEILEKQTPKATQTPKVRKAKEMGDVVYIVTSSSESTIVDRTFRC